MRCTHYACQCARARELAAMADRSGDPRLMYEAANVGEVECRMQTPKGERGSTTELSTVPIYSAVPTPAEPR